MVRVSLQTADEAVCRLRFSIADAALHKFWDEARAKGKPLHPSLRTQTAAEYLTMTEAIAAEELSTQGLPSGESTAPPIFARVSRRFT
jgi:hypothetical protein